MKSTLRESQLVLLLDDDCIITEALAAGLEREDRTVITCNDLESAELIVERLSPSHVVSDVRLSGPFGFEGLDFIRHVKRHSPGTGVILMTGEAPEALQLEAADRGAVAFLQKPFPIEDLDSVLDLISCPVKSSAAVDDAIIRMPLLEEVLSGGGLQPLFQPIVALSDYQPVGCEALTRFRNNSLLRDPSVLFQYATRKDRVRDLELACVTQALRAGAQLTRTGSLFMNIHPEVFIDARKLRERLVRESERYGISLDRIVLEITEQGSLPEDRSVFEEMEEIRKLGVRLALDDVGIAYSHLPFIDRIRPSFLKISQHFGTAFETDSTKMKIVANLQSLARDFDCDLILEGIEHASTAEMAASMNIKFGQGFFFGQPAEAASLLV